MATTIVKLKTWQFAWNLSNAISTVEGTDCSDLFVRVKNALKGFGSSPWAVVGSSNSVVAALDGVDRIAAIANVVKNPAAHSWIVLKQAGVSGTNTSLCFDFNSSQANLISIVVSPGAGFTGGSTTARPTATDEHVIMNQDYWLANGGSRQYRAHVLQSTDGQCTRIFVETNNLNIFFLMVDRAKNPVPAWTNPCVYMLRANGLGNGIAGPNNLNLGFVTSVTPQFYGIAPDGTTRMSLNGTVEGYGSGTGATPVPAIFNYGNELEAAAGRANVYHYVSVGLMHTATAGMRGRHGELFDMWFTSTLLSDGDGAPAAGTKDFCVLGEMIVPNNGTSVLIS